MRYEGSERPGMGPCGLWQSAPRSPDIPAVSLAHAPSVTTSDTSISSKTDLLQLTSVPHPAALTLHYEPRPCVPPCPECLETLNGKVFSAPLKFRKLMYSVKSNLLSSGQPMPHLQSVPFLILCLTCTLRYGHTEIKAQGRTHIDGHI